MTTHQQLINRVRSNINEPSTAQEPLRSDSEIMQWLQDGTYDYIGKVPADAVPELISKSTFSGTYWNIPADFIKLSVAIISHGITAPGATLSTTLVDQCKILDIDEQYFFLNCPSWSGALAIFDKVGSTKSLVFGPGALSGTISYIGLPATFSATSGVFPLTVGHEEPIVNYATAMALGKINDEDAPRYLERYNERIAAENGVKYPAIKKVTKKDPSES